MQLRFATGLSSEQYVSEKLWEKATLSRCPLHPKGGCGFARHGTYSRNVPEGTRVARFYCPKGKKTFSLLPDCLASRLKGSLFALESVVRTAENGTSIESTAEKLRPDIELPGAVRWLRRRIHYVRQALTVARGLFPEPLAGVKPTLFAFRAALVRGDGILHHIRSVADGHLRFMPSPVGLSPRWGALFRARDGPQQSMGPVRVGKKA